MGCKHSITINVPAKYKEENKTKATTFKFMLYQNLPMKLNLPLFACCCGDVQKVLLCNHRQGESTTKQFHTWLSL